MEGPLGVSAPCRRPTALDGGVLHTDDRAGVRAAVGDRRRRRVAVVGVGVNLEVVVGIRMNAYVLGNEVNKFIKFYSPRGNSPMTPPSSLR